MRKAIATLAIGEQYQWLYRTYARPTWQAYAKRLGYHIVCFEQPLDDSERARRRSPAWQKLLILGRPEIAGYDTVVWLDTDVIINHHIAPCIAGEVSDGRLGLCEETDLPDLPLFALMRDSVRQLREQHERRHGIEPGHDMYAVNGFENPPKQLFNTGVMVLSATKHREFLEHIYAHYEDHGAGGAYEMGALSYNIARGAVPHQVLDPRFNALWYVLGAAFGNIYQKQLPVVDGRVALLGAIFSKVFFLHFAGTQISMRDLRFLRIGKAPVTLNEDRAKRAVAKMLGSSSTGSPRPSGG